MRKRFFIFSLMAMGTQTAVAEEVVGLDAVSVTASREPVSIAETPASVGVVDADEVDHRAPSHASELLNHLPGVNIVQLGSSGQGVAAQIRQPISYGPVYLYLENGVPTRSAGFFNHNALYEVNSAMADGAEVFKGPGSALYGSEAIGGIVNILSGQLPEQDRLRLGLEAGDFHSYRAQLKSSKVTDKGGLTFDMDIMQNDGWRDYTGTERYSFGTSWHTQSSNGTRIKNFLTATVLDMETGGSGLLKEDFDQDPDQPGNLIGYRDVRALRWSSVIEKDVGDDGLFTITPFIRSNELEYVATWTLNTGREVPNWRTGIPTLDSQDAHINESGHDSLGALLKYRWRGDNELTLITGLDLEYSQGYQKQTYIERTDNDTGDYWLSYSDAGLLYDYDVGFSMVSPYIQAEKRVTPKLGLQAGLRYDYFEYDYDNQLSVVEADDPNTDRNEGLQLRPADTKVDLDHFSPKLGMVYNVNPGTAMFAAYRHGFRIPTSGQLFRSGQTQDSTELDPVKVDSVEFGIKGAANTKWSYEGTLYYMEGRDEIVSVRDDVSGGRRNVNTGETKHYGIELGNSYRFTPRLYSQLSYTHSRHEYEQWQDRSGDFSGNQIPLAPRNLANIQLNYEPDILNGGRLNLEWQHFGRYYIDEQNTESYSGHRLVNLRANYYLGMQLEFYLKVLNVADTKWAETASKWGPKFTPGRPRTALMGARYTF